MMRTFIMLLIMFTVITAESQVRRNTNRPGIPQEPSEKEIERQREKAEQRLEDFINNFLSTLDADEFQQVIIKQKLQSYRQEKQKIFNTKYERSIERIDAVSKLNENHFKDIEELISEEDMGRINEFVEGNFDDKDIKKKKRKNRKKKSKN